jgi:hypothetical protein
MAWFVPKVNGAGPCTLFKWHSIQRALGRTMSSTGINPLLPFTEKATNSALRLERTLIISITLA